MGRALRRFADGDIEGGAAGRCNGERNRRSHVLKPFLYFLTKGGGRENGATSGGDRAAFANSVGRVKDGYHTSRGIISSPFKYHKRYRCSGFDMFTVYAVRFFALFSISRFFRCEPVDLEKSCVRTRFKLNVYLNLALG